MDAIFMGTRAAIFDTQIPKTEVQDLGDGQFEFEVLDDAEDTDSVEGKEDMPICVTLNKVKPSPKGIHQTVFVRLFSPDLATNHLFLSTQTHRSVLATSLTHRRWKNYAQKQDWSWL